MKKLAFTIYMTLLFSLLAIVSPAQTVTNEEPVQTGPIELKAQNQRGISRMEARKLRKQNRAVRRLQHRVQRDGMVSPQEQRRVRAANRRLNQNIRRERRDFNRH